MAGWAFSFTGQKRICALLCIAAIIPLGLGRPEEYPKLPDPNPIIAVAQTVIV